jgi:hypothetical protein
MAGFFQDYVNFTITNSDQKDGCVGRRFPRDITVADLKVMSYLFLPRPYF